MWRLLHKLYAILKTTVTHKLYAIVLTKVSEKLAMKRKFNMAVPGCYAIDQPYPMLEYIEPVMQVLSTQQHPRCIFFYTDKGDKMKYLLKGNDDIRIDQRLMQFFGLVNSIIKQNRIAKDSGAEIIKYSVVPLAPNTGLIGWVTAADTLLQVISEYRTTHQINEQRELYEMAKYTNASFQSLNYLQRLEMFDKVCEVIPSTDVREFLWEKAPNASTWLARTDAFTISTALMSMVGYVIGLGDRHPSNIMVQKETGRVIHIDFGDSFESTIHRKSYPERVPFRLTRMIISTLDGCTYDGLFRKKCEDFMTLLRENRRTLTAQLEIFIHDPLSNESELNARRMEIVNEKLSGYDKNKEVQQSIEERVDWLIKEASDRTNYIAHYYG
jgi:FKBP12-rapamycin complex-associated protein